MNLAFYMRILRRESRGFRGRLLFFVLSLSVGVAAVVAVAGLRSSVDAAIRGRARDILGADLTIESNRPLPPELDRALAEIGPHERTEVSELATVVAMPAEGDAPGKSQLVELKAIDGEYPLYGALDLRPPGRLSELLDAESVVCARELCARLGASVGDTLMVGGVPFRIAAEVLADPDRLDFSLALGPRVFVTSEGLARTTLVTFGSRVEYRRMIKLAEDDTPERVAGIVRSLRRDLSDAQRLRVEGYSDAQPALRRAIDRVDTFSSLLALLTLLLGGIGVAETVRAWLAGRLESIAIAKCIGMRPREVFFSYAGQTVLLALLGSTVGIALGVGLQLLLPAVLGDVLPRSILSPWHFGAIARGLVLGVGVACVFSIPPLLSVLRVPPALVLRRDAKAVRPGRGATWISFAVLALGVYAAAAFQTRNAVVAAQFTGGIALAAGLLALVARAMAWCVGRVPREKVGLYFRYGLAALARPDSGALSAVVALGLGILLVLGAYLVQEKLSDELGGALAKDTPTAFMVDVQPAQWPEVERLLAERGATHVQSVPVISARLSAIDGVPVDELSRRRRERGRGRWVLTREQRLTYLDRLPDDNRIVDGALWSDPARAEVSLEKGYAEDLGAEVGTTLVFDVQGAPVELLVTSVRTVEWKTFGINFFIVVEPGVLESAPQFRIAAARLPEGRTQEAQDALAERFPNITLLQIREILERVQGALAEIGRGVRILGGFTVFAGLAILFGAIGTSAARRGREVALFKTLGTTRAGVAIVYGIEYALIGVFAASIGVTGGAVLSWAVLTRGMELTYSVPAAPLAACFALCIALSVAAGLGASARALSMKPLAVLRE